MTKRLDTVGTMACMKTLLMLFNVVFWASGVLIVCTVLWIEIQLQHYVDISMDGVWAALIALGGFGLFLSLAVMLACCCTTRGHPALLHLYGAFLAVVALLELGVGASVYANRTCLRDKFYLGLNESMAEYGRNDIKRDHIDSMQATLECCGHKSYTDWLELYPQMAIPLSCCKVSRKTCNVNETDDIYTQGCYTRALDLINDNLGLVAGTAIGVAFFPFIGVFLACCLANNINKAKYEQVA
ncbi:tetraspanin-7-like isoform X2 [Hylaeus anthracinus]|uniref:tetraspanin-7-like isoform X2 n=1 Tax=Hylaeus volcanicus TaxID=313075 RepID=UPI0023B7CF44|nr:tetraspanin-7-like isoform X2 [Hylaeus volcanicus]XP_054000956.1 tetraspanin-7-like isoform X2 [Hylaeus anthracinus]